MIDIECLFRKYLRAFALSRNEESIDELIDAADVDGAAAVALGVRDGTIPAFWRDVQPVGAVRPGGLVSPMSAAEFGRELRRLVDEPAATAEETDRQ